MSSVLPESTFQSFQASVLFPLWDQPHVLWERGSVARESAQTIKNFLQELSTIENSFSSALLSLVTKYDAMSLKEGPSLSSGWKVVLSQIREFGTEFEDLSKATAEVTSGSDLQQAGEVLESPIKGFQETVSAAQTTFQKKLDAVASVEREKKPESEIRSARSEKEAAEAGLANATVSALAAFEELEAQRVQGVREALSAVASRHGLCLQPLVKTALQATRSVRAISTKEDLEALCASKASGTPCSWGTKPATPETLTAPTATTTTPLPSVTAKPRTKPSATLSRHRAKGIKLGVNDKHNHSYATMKLSSNKRPATAFTEMKAQTPTGLSSHSAVVDDDADEAFLAAMKFATMKATKAKEAQAAKLAKEEVERKARIESEQKEKARKETPKEPEDEADEAFLAAMKFAAAKKAEKKANGETNKPAEQGQTSNFVVVSPSSQTTEDYYSKHAAKSPSTPTAAPSATPARTAPPPPLDVTKVSSPSAHTSQIEASRECYRAPIVVDNGSGYFKAGFAGDLHPHLVVTSAVACYPKNEYKQSGGPLAHMVGSSALHIGPQLSESPSSVNVNEMLFSDNPQWDDVELAWEYLLSRLSDDYAEHPILMTQPCLAPLKLKSVMQEILYEKFGVRELFIAEAPLLSAYAYGHSTGLVVDVGHSSAQIVPCVDGYVLSAHVQRVKHFGGFADTKRVVEYFRGHTNQKDPLELSKYSTSGHLHLMAQAIKDRLCVCPSSKAAYDDEYAVMDEVKGFLGGRNPEDERVAPKRPHSVTLHRALLTCGETCFSPQAILEDDDASIVSIQQLCANVVAKCDVDTRNALLSNVFLSGQVTTMPGFDDRLLSELKATIPHASNIKVFGESRRYAPWVGGSVLASLDDFSSEWRAKEDWEGDR